MFYILVLLFVITVIVCGSILKKNNVFENFTTQRDKENERQINRQINYCNSLIDDLGLTEPIKITNI